MDAGFGVPISERGLYGFAGKVVPPGPLFVLVLSGAVFLRSAPILPPSPVRITCAPDIKPAS